MNLIIDIGNTNIKLAVFKKHKLIHKRTFIANALLKNIDALRKEFEFIKHVIISSVGKLKKKELDFIKSHFEVIVLGTSTNLPFQNLYKTPKTLGTDRMALVSASVNQYPKQNVLIIDAGTCITYDFITSDNQYLGGAISPGIKTRYQSLNNLTTNLPLLEAKEPKNSIGNTTITSIHSGIINGVLYEIDGIIEDYNKKVKDLTVILTGGDTNFLSKRLKSSIFANSNFLLEGLNFILEFNLN